MAIDLIPITSVRLSEPVSLLEAVRESGRGIDVELSETSEPWPFRPGPVHQVLASVHADGNKVIARLPNADSLSGSSSLLANVFHRFVLVHADAIIGHGRRDLSQSVQFGPSQVVSTSDLQMQIYDPFLQPRSEVGVPEMCHAEFEAVRMALKSALLALKVPQPTVDQLPELTSFLKEALDNAYLHARYEVASGAPLRGFQGAVLRRYDSRALDHLGGDFEGSEIQRWREGVAAWLNSRVQDQLDVLEITISDAGEGIAATMEESRAIYGRPHVFELEAIDRALQPGTTRAATRPNVAPRTKKGQGFPQMLQRLHQVRGAVMIWTGRSLLTWSSLEVDGSRREIPIGKSKIHAWTIRETTPTTGTSIAAVIPLPAMGAKQAESLFDAQ